MFLPDLVVRSRRLVTDRAVRPGAIHIRGGKIIGILDFDDVPPGCPIDDAADTAIIPGVVDTHVYVSAPGLFRRDAFEATTRAAAAGGVTTIVDMPFGRLPATTTVQALERKRAAAAQRCYVDLAFWGGAIPGNMHDLASLWEAGVLGFACVLAPSGSRDFPPVSETDLRTIMSGLTRTRAPLLVDAGTAEDAKIPMLGELCRQYQTATHLVHLSSSEALTPLFHARSARVPISADTCPHFLYVAPKAEVPVRVRQNREMLWAALANGLIQMVGSGHGPHARAALQTSVARIWAEARARGYTLDQLAGWMCRAPAQLAGLNRKGRIDVGYDADLAVFNPESGVVERTYLRGFAIYSRAHEFGATTGRLITRASS